MVCYDYRTCISIPKISVNSVIIRFRTHKALTIKVQRAREPWEGGDDSLYTEDPNTSKSQSVIRNRGQKAVGSQTKLGEKDLP